LLAAISFFGSLWVYLRWNHPAEFVYAGSHPRTESAASVILAYPIFQVVLSSALAWQAIRWRTFSRAVIKRELELRATDERFRQLSLVALVQAVSCCVVLINLGLLMSTIYRIWTLAPGA